MAFLNIPALLLIVGGTSGAVMASTNFQTFMGMPKGMIMSFKGSSIESGGVIQEMVALAEKARRDGLLALEEDVAEVDDAYTKKGLQLVVDGTDSDLVRTILESEIDGMAQRHRPDRRHVHDGRRLRADARHPRHRHGPRPRAREPLEPGRRWAPRSRARSSPRSTACGSANLLFLPSATSSRRCRRPRSTTGTWCSRPILSIQAGDNPRMLAEKLETFLPPSKRGAPEKGAPAVAAVAR